MRSQRPGRKVFKNPGASFGVKVIEPGFPSAAGGWWDDFGAIACCVAAYQGRAVANYATSLINLANPGVNNLVAVAGAPNWNAVQGWFNFLALNTALNTGLVPAADQSWSCLVQFANATLGWRVVSGAYSGVNRGFRLFACTALPRRVAYENGGIQTPVPQLLTGNLGVAGNQGYRNGGADGGAIAAWAGASVFPIWIGAGNNLGALNFPTDGDLWAASYYSCTLTAPQMAAVAAWMAAI